MRYKVIRRRIKDALFGKSVNTAMGGQFFDAADARMGTIFFLSKLEFEHNRKLSSHVSENFVGNSEPLQDAKAFATYLLNNTKYGKKVGDAVGANLAKIKSSKVGKAVSSVAHVAGEATHAIIEKIKGFLADFFNGLINKVKSVYGSVVGGVEWLTEFGTWLGAEFSGGLAELIPGLGYAQSAADIYSGVKQAILKTKSLVEQVYEGRGVQLLGGHPSIIANALARHSISGIVGGVKGAVMGGVSIGLEAAGDAAGGAGTIVAFVTGTLERIVDAVDRIIQLAVLKRTIKRAKKEWEKHVAGSDGGIAGGASTNPIKNPNISLNKRIFSSGSALIRDHDQFSNWFQNVVVTSPIVAALLLGTGFVAHPLKFLQLMSESDMTKLQTQFDRGVNYILKLKELSADYMQEYMDNYAVDFKSSDGIVNQRLNELAGKKAHLDGFAMGVLPAGVRDLIDNPYIEDSLKPSAQWIEDNMQIPEWAK